jgi:1-acyl-sn-glycerol-3-phosphate acyltransferase
MKKPSAMPVVRARPSIKTAEPRISPWLVFLARFAARFYLAGFVGNARIRLDENAAGNFLPAMERALSRKSRCILAFRHQNGWEPQVLMWFTLYRLAKFAGKQGIRFSLPPRILFVHGYELFRWGGPLLRFALPRFGAMPIHHAKLDSAGLKRIYRCLREGPYPLAIAPEGQVSYTLAEKPRVEPGTVHIALGVAEELLAGAGTGAAGIGGSPAVEILPVSLYPEYDKKALAAAEGLLRRIERICGIKPPAAGPGGSGLRHRGLSRPADLGGRFLRCREIILALNERRYGLNRKETTRKEAVREGRDFGDRLDAVIEAALQNAAGALGFKDLPGDTISRLYLIRQTCWDRIFPEHADLRTLSPLERAFLDLRAGEAWYAARHMELADFSFYFHKPPGESPASVVEYAQNLYDFANRTMGGIYGTRRNIPPAVIHISAAPPINLTEMLRAGGENPGGKDLGGEHPGGEHRKSVSAEANELLKQRLG